MREITKAAPRRRRAVVVLAVLTALLWAASLPAEADETACTGTIGAQTLDDVAVPDGASCTLDGTRVEGNVVVGDGARLTASDVDVDGNVQAEGSAHVAVSGSRVGGNVQVEQGGGAQVVSTLVDGDIQVEASSSEVDVDENEVGGNVQLFSNSAGVSVTDNAIDGDLQCGSNDPAPTGGGNTVQGNAEGQCAQLAGGSGDGGSEPPPSTIREIDRIAGADRFETAVEISRDAFPDGASVVYLARGDVAADALGAKSLTDGPVLLVPGCSGLPEVVATEISRLDPAGVVALGGPAAVCDETLTAAGNVR